MINNMIATTWVTKIRMLILEKLTSSCLTDFGYTDHLYLFKKYCLINDLSFE